MMLYVATLIFMTVFTVVAAFDVNKYNIADNTLILSHSHIRSIMRKSPSRMVQLVYLILPIYAMFGVFKHIISNMSTDKEENVSRNFFLRQIVLMLLVISKNLYFVLFMFLPDAQSQ